MMALIGPPLATLPWKGLKNKPDPPACCTLQNVSDDMPSAKGPAGVLAEQFQLTGVASVCVETAVTSRSGFASRFWARAKPANTKRLIAPPARAAEILKCLSICL